MSSTRHAEEGSPFRQERFASSPAFDRGLMGNLVAKRCQVLEDAGDRDLVWHLQLASHAPGGLKKLCAELLAAHPDSIATASMQRFGFSAGQIYDADQVRAVLRELPKVEREAFPLRGERTARECRSEDAEIARRIIEGQSYEMLESARTRDSIESGGHPDSYPAKDFKQRCEHEARYCLERFLMELCLNPEQPMAGPYYFPTLIETLREREAQRSAAALAAYVRTSIAELICDALEYSVSSRCMVLIEGRPLTGKTHTAEWWTSLYPGRVRYAVVPPTTDDIGFFSAIAKSLGVSVNQNSKAQQLRERIEEVLQGGDLALVLDSSHYLWPQSKYRDALPSRVNWLVETLVKNDVPVALIASRDFLRAQCTVERKTGWSGEQFSKWLGDFVTLPDSLDEPDLTAIARSLAPGACDKSIETVVYYAQASQKYLPGIVSALRRARHTASKAGRDNVIFEDVKDALRDKEMPADRALSDAMQSQIKGRRNAAAPAPPLTSAATAPAPAHPRETSKIISPALGRKTNLTGLAPVTSSPAARRSAPLAQDHCGLAAEA